MIITIKTKACKLPQIKKHAKALLALNTRDL
jgi:hypothetical protein